MVTTYHHLDAAAEALYADKHILSDKDASDCHRLHFFYAMVTPVVCFGAGPRVVHAPNRSQMRRREGKKIVRNFVNTKCGRPPLGIDWSEPCLTILRVRGTNGLQHVFSDLGYVRGRKST